MEKKIPFLQLGRIHEPLLAEFVQHLEKTVRDSSFIGGSAVKEFEAAFESWLGNKGHVASCANGTDALTLGAKALEFPKGAKALVPSMSYIATAVGLLNAGLEVDFVEVDPQTYLMDPEKLETYLKSQKADLIVPVHLYGQMAEMDKISEIAKRYGAKVLEDAAQAHGATWKGNAVGSLADVATFSFYPGKNLGALGDGGAVFSTQKDLIERCRLYANLGQPRKYEHQLVGFNSRLDSLQAGFLTAKLKYLDGWNKKRRRVADEYREFLSGVSQIQLPVEKSGAQHVYHLYVIQVPDREKFMSHLASHGIDTGIHYPMAMHEHQALKSHLKSNNQKFPVAEKLARHGVSLPMDPSLSTEDVRHVSQTIAGFFK